MSETIDEAIFFDERDCRVAVDPRNDECSTSLWEKLQRTLHLIAKTSLRGMSEVNDEAIFFDSQDCHIAVAPRDDEERRYSRNGKTHRS